MPKVATNPCGLHVFVVPSHRGPHQAFSKELRPPFASLRTPVLVSKHEARFESGSQRRISASSSLACLRRRPLLTLERRYPRAALGVFASIEKFER